MKLKYDSNLKIAGLGITPWARLGLERWLDNYKIASYYDADISDHPEIIASANHDIEPLKMGNVLADPTFQRQLADKLSGYTLLTYKPFNMNLPAFMTERQIRLSRGYQGPNLENKAVFRQRFSSTLPFPDFKIIDNPEPADIAVGEGPVVIQDQAMSGRRGTFIVSEPEEAKRALSTLRKAGKAKVVVVSKFVEAAKERSIQGVVTRHGVFVGPLQKQIVANPNLSPPGGRKDKFCGAEISSSDSGLSQQAGKIGQAVGKELQQSGYKGVFGVDLLIGADGKLYVLEVNQRITGVTPLLTALYRDEQDIPFYLLHALEACDSDYEMLDKTLNPEPPTGSLLVMHNKSANEAAAEAVPGSGLYDLSGRQMKTTLSYGALEQQSYLLQRHYPPGVPTESGGRLAHVFIKSPVLNPDDSLNQQSLSIVEHVYGAQE